jgi:hypothetical protein
MRDAVYHDRDVRAALDACSDLGAIHLGHHEVEQHQVRRLLVEGVEGLVTAVRRRPRSVAWVAEEGVS